MASLGNMSLKTSVDNSGISSGLQQAENKVKATGTNITSLLGAGAIVGAVGGGIAAAVGAVTNGFERLNQIRKDTRTANALGIDPAQFQGLSLLLQRAGIDASQTGDFFGGLAAKIERAAATGRGPAARAMETLGLSFDQIRSLPIDQQFLTIADALSKLPAGAQQASIALNLFGSTAILPQIQKGREGIQNFINEAINSGQILSSEQSQLAMNAAKAWDDAKKSLTRAWDSVSTSVAIALAPIVEKGAAVFAKVVEAVKPFLDGLKGYLEDLSAVASAVWQVIGEAINATWDILKGFWETLGDITGFMPSFREIVSGAFRYIFVGVSYVADGIKAIAGSMTWLAGQITGNNKWASMGASMVQSFGSSATRVNQIFDQIGLRQTRIVQAATNAANRAATTVREAIQEAFTIDFKIQNKALIVGTSDEYQARAQWETMNQFRVQNNLNRQQLDALMNIDRNTRRQGNGRGREADTFEEF